MTFQDEIKAVVAANQLSTDFRAEVVEFVPANGDQSRRITVTVRRRQLADQNQGTLDQREEYVVLIGKDPTADIGGVLQLRQNDQIIRRVDDTEMTLTFTGQIMEENVATVRALFNRVTRKVQGRGAGR